MTKRAVTAPRHKTLGAFTALLMLCAEAFATNPEVVFKTNRGDITVELYPQEAPITVANFLRYVEAGLFDNTIFHRVINDFIIQGGGLTLDLEKAPTYDPILNEASNGLSNEQGTIAMARTSNPHSATGQFFINLADNDFLDFSEESIGYTVFGRVIAGLDVVEAIAAVDTHTVNNYENVPVAPVIITQVVSDAIRAGLWVTISPSSGLLLTSQEIDLAFMVGPTDLELVSAQILLDGIDITSIVIGCGKTGALLPSGGISLRCPNVQAAALGIGVHILEIILDYSDGSRITDKVTWDIRQNKE